MRRLIYELSDGTIVRTLREAEESGLNYKPLTLNIEENKTKPPKNRVKAEKRTDK